MPHIIDNNFSVIKNVYEIKDVKFQFVGAESIGPKAKDTIDSIKNLTTGVIKKINRMKIYEYTRKNKPK